MSRAEWLAGRARGLGGSDVGQIPSIVAACGGDPERDCAPWASEWRVWWSKRNGGEDLGSGGDTADMAVGRWLEAPVLEWARDELGGARVELTSEDVRSLFVERPPLVGTPDGFGVDPERTMLVGIEAKVSADWEPWETPPFYYLLQCRTYLAITRAHRPEGLCAGVDRWVLAVYFRRANVRRLYTIERDPEAEQTLQDAAAWWWDRHVVGGEEPGISDDPACARALERLHPRTAGASFADFRLATDQEIAWATEAARLEQLATDIGRDIDTFKNRLRGAIGDAPGLRWSGGSVRWSRNRIAVKLETP